VVVVDHVEDFLCEGLADGLFDGVEAFGGVGVGGRGRDGV